ncbi:MAG TPA: DUF4349 domain-containing protein [Candidatus Dormibacteraeota bacterium]
MKRLNLSIVGLLGLLLVVGMACGGGATAGESSGPPHSAAQPAAGTSAQASTGTTTPSPIVTGEGPRVIRTAQLGIEVRSGQFDSTLSRLIQLAGTEGGYVAASNAGSEATDRIRTGTVTFAIPVEHFQATVDELRSIGKLQSINISAQDVSQQYVDLQARLRNAEAQRDAMLALLGQAHSVSDIILIQNQLATITGQIEQLKGQIAYLDHATAYSTISVVLREAGVAPPPADEWGLRTSLLQGLHNFVSSVDGIVLVLATVGPYMLLVLLGFGVWRARRRPLSQ